MSAHPRTDRHAAHALHTQPAPLDVDYHHTALQPLRHPKRLPADRISLRHGLVMAAVAGLSVLASCAQPGPWF